MSKKRTSDIVREGVQEILNDHYNEDALLENDMLGSVVYTQSDEAIQIIDLKPPTFVYKKNSITSESKFEH